MQIRLMANLSRRRITSVGIAITKNLCELVFRKDLIIF